MTIEIDQVAWTVIREGDNSIGPCSTGSTGGRDSVVPYDEYYARLGFPRYSTREEAERHCTRS